MSNSRDPFEEGSYYHIINKSFGNTILWETANDYKTFMLQIIDHWMGFSSIKILSYCILPDHFHLIVFNSKKGFDISNFLRKIQISYAMYFKKKHSENPSLKGLPVFKGRFKAIHIPSDMLEEVVSYINYNPLHHEIVSSESSRPYCSIHQFVDTGYDYSQDTYIKINQPDIPINIYPNTELKLDFEIN